MIITKKFRFDSAHKLPNYKGDCANVHGHSYKLFVSVSGDVNEQGFVIDFKDLNNIVSEKVISKLDHSNLNDFLENPTAENIVIWIWNELKDYLNLSELKLYETEDSYVVYVGD